MARQGWEDAEFPIVCETCLGENPYVRMTKHTHGRECKICLRPFTVFLWVPGKNARKKTTVICSTCAKMKNVCQCCVLDLEFGLPVQVRDTVLNIEKDEPKQDLSRQYLIAQVEDKLGASSLVDSSRVPSAAREQLRKMARPEPYFKRNAPHVCTFYVKGECNRGEACPYRHELPNVDDKLRNQNIRERYLGTNDPVAEKMLRRTSQVPAPPADKAITSLYLTQLPPTASDADIRELFSPHGTVRSIVLLQKSHAAFVNFASRQSAEEAMQALSSGAEVAGKEIRISWGRKPGSTGVAANTGRAQPYASSTSSHVSDVASKHEMVADGASQQAALDAFLQSLASAPPPPGVASGTSIKYASMDPTALGSRAAPRESKDV